MGARPAESMPADAAVFGMSCDGFSDFFGGATIAAGKFRNGRIVQTCVRRMFAAGFAGCKGRFETRLRRGIY